MSTYHVSCDSCRVIIINNHACHEIGCRGVLIFTRRGQKYQQFRVWSLDLWGDEVNDRSCIGRVMVPQDASDRAIIKALKRKGWVNPKCHYDSFSIEGDEHFMSIDYKHKPIYQLEGT